MPVNRSLSHSAYIQQHNEAAKTANKHVRQFAILQVKRKVQVRKNNMAACCKSLQLVSRRHGRCKILQAICSTLHSACAVRARVYKQFLIFRSWMLTRRRTWTCYVQDRVMNGIRTVTMICLRIMPLRQCLLTICLGQTAPRLTLDRTTICCGTRQTQTRLVLYLIKCCDWIRHFTDQSSVTVAVVYD